jgi:glucose/arabinose dehydrogenase/lysophospholipase L1-like esterase
VMTSLLVIVLLTLPAGVTAKTPSGPTLRAGDHISLIGGALAERMQHAGWLETLIQARFPEHALSFRNLGFSGDELTVRLRSADFGSQDEWLERCKTDVVFAFFGFNESFAGREGLEKFRTDLDTFITHTREQQYDGEHKARLVLFSPIAHENLHDRNLPDGSANNQRLALYTTAMAEVAEGRNVPFIDLFTASRKRYAQCTEPLTVNGVHLNENGNKLIAKEIDEALFGPAAPVDEEALEKLRRAVADKNFHWYQRYRVVDGYNVYGGRSSLRYKPNVPVREQSNDKRYKEGISNREVMDREMEVLDVMTANRDRRIWALAEGKDYAVDDGNTPPFIEVLTNHPGTGPNGEHILIGGAEAIEKMTPAKGMKVSLFADEKTFPDLINPVQMAFDTRGRLWVATWPTYPHWTPKSPMNDKLLILEDTDHDGRADKVKVFADGLHCPTGFEFYDDGVLVAQAPYIVYVKDTDGDDKADVYRRLISSLDSADTHHTANSFVFDPGGSVYFQEGTFHRTQVETLTGPMRCTNACVWRFNPRTFAFEEYISYSFANPHGHVFDRWGQDIVHDGTGADPFHAALFSGRVYYPRKHPRPPELYKKRTRPCAGTEILSSRHFPEANQGNLLVANVIGFRGILQYRIEEKGSSLFGTEVEPIVESSDPNFRPADIEIGPDGAIWFTDWQNPIIGHMQHHIRDPNRDIVHGRVYRVTYDDRPLTKPADIAGAPIDKLLELLTDTDDRVRYRAKIELSGRDSDEVIAAVNQWVNALDTGDPEIQHHLLEALWVHQWHNVVNEPLLRRMLDSPDHRARAAATRVLGYWRDRVEQPLALLETLVNDKHPGVRLQAVRACSFLETAKAAEVALEATQHEMDEYLEYVLKETLETLKRFD